MSNKEETFAHESYGMIGLSRCRGNVRLYGSSISNHGNFVTMRISHGERVHYLSKDWYRSTKRIAEIYLSSAQFAEMITSMNMGEGIPCTINWLNGSVEEPPDVEIETEKVHADFNRDLKDLVKNLKDSQKEIKDILGQKSIKVADRKTIEAALAKIVQDVEANIPFVLSQFQEAAEKVVSHAKAEIEAFTTARVMTARVAALTEADPNPTLVLEK